jgi:uncharacterized damage-inducible protein DinB
MVVILSAETVSQDPTVVRGCWTATGSGLRTISAIPGVSTETAGPHSAETLPYSAGRDQPACAPSSSMSIPASSRRGNGWSRPSGSLTAFCNVGNIFKNNVKLVHRPQPGPSGEIGLAAAMVGALWHPAAMSESSMKADLRRYLQLSREAVLWKLEGLSPYECRRPLVPTGTNLLGLVKHLAGVEAGYFGATFDRPFPQNLPWIADDAEPNADLWADAGESVEGIVAQYRRVWAHSDATVAALSLDSLGQVPWWPADRREVTLHRILIHMIAETNRHAGHADLVRELVDGTVGLGADNDNLAPGDAAWWEAYREKLEQVARDATD